MQRPLQLQSGRAAGNLRPGYRHLPAPISRRSLRLVAFKPDDDSVDDPISRTKTKTVTKQQYARGHGHNKGIKGWKDAGWDLDTKTLDGSGTNLRRLILNYGEMAQATYDNLVSDKRDPKNPRHGSCYDASGKTLLQNSVPADSPVASKYTVTNVLYGQAGAAALKTDDADLNWIMTRLGLLSAIPIKLLNPLRLAAGRGKKPRPAFMGYIAKSKPEGKYEEVDVAVVFRGTIFYEEWENNFRGDIPAKWNLADVRARKNPACAPPTDIGVHTGFMDIYTEPCAQRQADDGSSLAPPKLSPFEVVEAELLALMKQSNVTTISTTGHSLGGGLCTLSALHIGQYVEELFQRPESEREGWATKAKPTVTSFAFASPRVGNFQFLEEFKRLHIRNLRICNKYDKVPQTPGVFGSQLVTGLLDKLGFNLYNDLEGQPAYSFWRWYNTNITLPKSEWGSKLVESWQNAERALLSKFGINKNPEEVDQQITFGFWDFCHVGQILELDSLKGPGTDLLLKPSQNDPRNIGKFHNLEMYLYLVANYLPDAGTVKPEQMENSKSTVSRRDPALLNKSDDLLDVAKAAQQEPRLAGTPACWWNLPFETKKDGATGKEVKVSKVVDQSGKPTGQVMVLKDDGGVEHWVYGAAASS